MRKLDSTGCRLCPGQRLVYRSVIRGSFRYRYFRCVECGTTSKSMQRLTVGVIPDDFGRADQAVARAAGRDSQLVFGIGPGEGGRVGLTRCGDCPLVNVWGGRWLPSLEPCWERLAGCKRIGCLCHCPRNANRNKQSGISKQTFNQEQ